MDTKSRMRMAWAFAAAPLLASPGSTSAAAELPYRISGPYAHENLHVFLIHGPGSPGTRRFLTLDRAIAEKKVVVRETGTVAQLTIENVSEVDVYVQAGEIVKGGRQDRVLGTDLLLPPKSGAVPIASHCVEQGRWSQRGGEPADRFSSADLALAHKDLKIANHAGAQGDVWSNVEKVQRKLATNVGGDVREQRSRSSLQLTLENERVRGKTDAYLRALSGLAQAHPDALGFAFAVNGEVNSADVYASPRLFAALWPKLLRAAATEAVAERTTATPPAPSLPSVRGLLAPADGSLTEKAPNRSTRTLLRESESRLVVETHEAAAGGPVVHRSYLNKTTGSR